MVSISVSVVVIFCSSQFTCSSCVLFTVCLCISPFLCLLCLNYSLPLLFLSLFSTLSSILLLLPSSFPSSSPPPPPPPSPPHSDHEDIGADTGITDENKAILEKVRLSTRQEYIQGGGATSSVRASDRLMRELRDIYRSQNFKDGESVGVVKLK